MAKLGRNKSGVLALLNSYAKFFVWSVKNFNFPKYTIYIINHLEFEENKDILAEM
jgi:hypothetical protein